MHTNYKIQFFTFIINILMALSLNSFSSSSVFLPALFLYFISNLASFLDKAWYYNENGFGTPQYHRYFFALGTAALIISFSLLIIRKRPK